MPIANFQRISFDEANPWLTGAARGQGLYQGLIQNMYAQPMAQQSLEQALAKTQQEQAQAKYADPMQQAMLQEQQMKAPHIQAMIDEIFKGKIPEEQTQATHLGAETHYMPLKYAIESANAMRQNSRFGDAYQFGRILQALPTEQRAAYISEHPDEYQNLLNTMGNKALQGQMAQQQDVLSGVVNKFFPGMPTGTNQGPIAANANGIPMTAPEMQRLGEVTGQQQSVSAMRDPTRPQVQQPIQQPILQQAQPQIPTFESTPKKKEDIENAFALAADNKLIGTQQRRRADASVTLEKWLLDNRERYAPMINDATKFAGLIGRGLSLQDAISQTSPEAYTNYKLFKTSFVPNLANQMRMQEGMGATDQQTKILEQMYQAGLNIDQNPDGAKKMINQAIKMTQDVGDAVFQGSEPIHKGIHRKMFGLEKLQGNYTDVKPKEMSFEDKVEYTMKKRGMTKDQVIAEFNRKKSSSAPVTSLGARG